MDAARISPREREVLGLLGEHLTHEEIGRRLFISVRTVESHVASLRRKLGLPGHRSLVRYAATQGPAVRPRPGLFAPLTSFVGRTAELTGLAAAVRGSRVVTATGPGGAGKTRLALAAASLLEPEFEGVWWVDLVLVTDPGQLDGAVAQACAAPVSSLLGPAEALAAAIGDRAVLLVLDNAEHVLDAAAVLVEQLATACPRLHVLLTSRARLALPFEQVFRVAGLSVAVDGDAVALFTERATAAGAPALDEAGRARAAAICASLGGLALAVELAAVRMPVLGLDGLEHSLADQPALLSGGSRVHPRHRSMRETLDWSMALLDPAAGAVLRRLSVLVAPFDTTAAEAVAAFPPLDQAEVRASLIQLAEHNLVTTTGGAGGIYRMLEPVRQYAQARMDAADSPAYPRHLRWCARSVAALLGEIGSSPGKPGPGKPGPGKPGAEQPAAREPGEREPGAVWPVADDARAALAWAAGQPDPDQMAAALARDLALLLFRAGTLGEAQTRFEQAARFEPDGRAAAASLARAAAVAKCRVLGEEALRLELAAAGRVREAGDAAGAACALGRAAELIYRFPGMFAAPGAWPPAGDLIAAAREIGGGDPGAAATLLVAVNGYAGPAGGPTRDSALAALAAARDAGDTVLESSALDGLVGATLSGGDIVQAHRLSQQRVALVTGWRDEPAEALELKDALHTGVLCALGAGDLPAAADLARRQHDLPFLRERRDLADDELATPAALAGDWPTAVQAGQRFLEDWSAAGRPAAPGRGLAPAAVALAHGLRGDRAARATWLGVLAQLRGVPRAEASRGSGYGELFEALVLLHEGQPAAALDALPTAAHGLFGAVFVQWVSAVRAEAAVLAGVPGAGALLDAASARARGNPVAAAITRRAAALRRPDQQALAGIADDFDRAGAPYQAARTRTLAATLRSAAPGSQRS